MVVRMQRLFLVASFVALAGAQGPPACGDATDMMCSERYLNAYGCSVQSLVLPEDDECFPYVGPLFCLETSCFSRPSPKMEEYCSPGCNASAIGDGICDVGCLNKDCMYDGGDCLDGPISWSSMESVMLSFDDGDSQLNYTEYMVIESNLTQFPWIDEMEYSKLVPKRMYGLDKNSLALLALSQMPMMPEHRLATSALWIFGLADKNKDYKISRDEATMFTVDNEILEDVDFDDFKEGLETMYAVFYGGEVEEDYNPEEIARGVMAASDFNMDGKISKMEGMLLFDNNIMTWLDMDRDMMVSMEELLSVLRWGDDVCDGFKLLRERGDEFGARMPLQGAQCAWLIQPSWYYKIEDFEMMRRSGMDTYRMRKAAQEREEKAAKIRAITKDSKEVRTPPAGSNVADNHLRAKEKRIRDEQHAKTRATFMGMPVSPGKQEFVASIEVPMMPQLCSGALVSPFWVITSASCVEAIQEAMRFTSTSPIVRIGSNMVGSGGEVHDIVDVAAHPGFSIDGGFDVGMIQLASPSMYTPAELYDGGDIGINDCTKMTMNYLAFGASDSLEKVDMRLYDFDKCGDWYHWVSGGEVVGPEELCASTMTHEVDCQNTAPGAPMVVTIPTQPNVTKLVGVATVAEGCHGKGMPAIFTRTSAVLQWVRSVSADLGKHPALKLSLTIQELGLPPHGGTLDVYAGGTATALWDNYHHLKTLDSKCQTPAMFEDGGSGSMLLVLTAPASNSSVECDEECMMLLGFKAEYKLMDCAENFMRNQGVSKGDCMDPGFGGIDGCAYTAPSERDNRPKATCMQPAAPLTVPWSKLGPMEDEGKVYSGGLGKRAVKDVHVEYGVWTCIRDWDIEEQMACAARHGDLCCYWYEERAREWHFQGLNQEVRLVRESEQERGMEIEAHRLMRRTLRTSPNQMQHP